jgi:hypothetical protein
LVWKPFLWGDELVLWQGEGSFLGTT